MIRIWWNMPSIYIDGDSCPVLAQILMVASEVQLPVFLVCDYTHSFDIEEVTILYCDKGRDAVDFILLQNIQKNDIVVTQDYGLAALCLSRQTYPISAHGVRYTPETINSMLYQRQRSALARRHRQKSSHVRKRTKEDDEAFLAAFEKLCRYVQELKPNETDRPSTGAPR